MSQASVSKAILTSFLDLICCGLGAAIMLFLITVTMPASADSDLNANIIVWAKIEQGPRAEIAIEYKGPGDTIWHRTSQQASVKSFNFSADTDLKTGGAAVFILPNPEPGEYEFRVVMVDFAKPDPNRSDSAQSQPRIAIEEYGNRIEVSRRPEPKTLTLDRPAATSGILTINVEQEVK